MINSKQSEMRVLINSVSVHQKFRFTLLNIPWLTDVMKSSIQHFLFFLNLIRAWTNCQIFVVVRSWWQLLYPINMWKLLSDHNDRFIIFGWSVYWYIECYGVEKFLLWSYQIYIQFSWHSGFHFQYSVLRIKHPAFSMQQYSVFSLPYQNPANLGCDGCLQTSKSFFWALKKNAAPITIILIHNIVSWLCCRSKIL
jgi:hypothetical protein